jgi:glutamate dehydrogenase (NAD(P)+)
MHQKIINIIGINIQKLFDYKHKNNSFVGFSSGKIIDNSPSELLEYDCDILIPAAMEQQITKANMHRIKAKIIGEGANGPITPTAHEYLVKKNVVIIPDMLLNAGGGTVFFPFFSIDFCSYGFVFRMVLE